MNMNKGNNSNNPSRRQFLGSMGAMLAAMATAKAEHGSSLFNSSGQPLPLTPINPVSGDVSTHVGIQMSPHTMAYEGIESTLDLIKEKAAVNAVYTYSHAFHTGDLGGKPIRTLAADHGKPVPDLRGKVPAVWVKHHEAFFKDTSLRVRTPKPGLEFADRDLFTEMVEPSRQRGMKVYARVLESLGGEIENFDRVRTIDWDGDKGAHACWSHPEYKNFWKAIVTDMFSHYDLDGFQWGAERMGPLMNIILPWNDDKDACFCEHCRARGMAAGIDPERAREGYRKLYEYVMKLKHDKYKPAEGVYTLFLRLIIRYPEILSWEYQYRLSREDIQADMYNAIKALKPEANVGWHVDHQPSSWDMVYRAEMSYEEMAPHSDYVKLILYHGVLGPRIYDWYLKRFQSTILSEISLEDSLNMYYDTFGYDKNVEPGVDELKTKGFSSDYVYRETKRSVASAGGKTKIYAGIGIDLPGSPPDKPELVYEATMKALEGGASGIVVSREYEEMTVPNLAAIGKAVREWESL